MALFPSKHILGVVVWASCLTAQPSAPVFEVVSIREVPPNAPTFTREQSFTPVLPGGQFVDSRTGLMWMIGIAYSRTTSVRLVGLPKWAEEQSYTVAAKPASGFPLLSQHENQEQVRLMLRAMLAERFHLQVHRETRQESVLRLVVAKGGFKLKEVEAPVAPDKEGFVNAAWGDERIRIIARKATMRGLADTLLLILKQPVVNETGVSGYYDIDVKWQGAEGSASTFGAEGEGLLIANLEREFGLRLIKGTGAVEYLVVDHVERPTEN